MVKNTIGGKKGKSIAKKNVMISNDNIRLSQNEDEIYVVCTKLYGNGIFSVVDNDGNEYKAVLRGKMKGFNKRHNLVSLFSILLIGKRVDLSDKSVVDILFVFEHSHIPILSLSPTIKIQHILNIHSSGNTSFCSTNHTDFDEHSLFHFTEGTSQNSIDKNETVSNHAVNSEREVEDDIDFMDI